MTMPYRALFPQRRLEWWLASFTVAWGMTLIADPQALDSNSYIIARLWASAPAWGCIAAVVGLFHVFALWINGRRWWSPRIRVAATVCNTGMFTALVGFILAARWYGFGPATATIIVYAGYVWAGVCAFRVAVHDACEIGRQRRRPDARV